MTHWTLLVGLGLRLSLAAPASPPSEAPRPLAPSTTADADATASDDASTNTEADATASDDASASTSTSTSTDATASNDASTNTGTGTDTGTNTNDDSKANGQADSDSDSEAKPSPKIDTDPGADPIAPDGTIRPIYRREDEFSAADLRRPSALTLETRSGRAERPAGVRRRRFRGVTIGVGGRLVVGRYQPDPFSEPSGEPLGYGAAGTPVVDVLAEFGRRRLRFVIGTMSAPVPIGFSDYWTSTIFGVRAGVLAGNERFRFGATAGGGIWFAWEIMAHAFITPWRDRRGSRHGIGVDAGVWLFHPALTLSYRVAPAAWNHVGGRRAAKDRARASLP